MKAGNDLNDPAITHGKNGDTAYLNCEFVIIEGPYARRKVFEKIGVQGTDRWVNMGKARTLQQERQEKQKLQNQIESDKPKVIFADAVATSESDVLIGELAKILKGNGINVGQNRLFERLRQDGFLIRRDGSDYNTPTQRAMNLGLFKLKETAITHSEYAKATQQELQFTKALKFQ